MVNYFLAWWNRYFSDPEAIGLGLVILASIGLSMWLGAILVPVIASIVLAYLLQWAVNYLQSWKIPKLVSVLIVYIGFLGLFLGSLLILWPILWHQFLRLLEELPSMVIRARAFLNLLPENLPQYVTKEMVDSWVATLSSEFTKMGRNVVTTSIAWVPNIISIIVYCVLVPIMVFFMLKDQEKIIGWCTKFLPDKRKVLNNIWKDVDEQIGNYIRGKAAEIIIIGAVSYITFYLLGLQYAALLAVLVGLSVIVPYVGAAVVTIPVLLVAFFQWNLDPSFWYVVIAYTVIQVIDGNVLVPILFSEAVNLHPLAIIVAIIIFGGLGGFWGVFFAIPLATLVRAIIIAWPESSDHKASMA